MEKEVAGPEVSQVPCAPPAAPVPSRTPLSLAATAPGGTRISVTNDDEAAREIVENEL